MMVLLAEGCANHHNSSVNLLAEGTAHVEAQNLRRPLARRARGRCRRGADSVRVLRTARTPQWPGRALHDTRSLTRRRQRLCVGRTDAAGRASALSAWSTALSAAHCAAVSLCSSIGSGRLAGAAATSSTRDAKTTSQIASTDSRETASGLSRTLLNRPDRSIVSPMTCSNVAPLSLAPRTDDISTPDAAGAVPPLNPSPMCIGWVME